MPQTPMQTTVNSPATRFSRSFVASASESIAPSLLVRIYPINGIEQPLEIMDQPLLVGRDPNSSLVLSEDSISRRHAIIESNGAAHLVSDLGSTNGTYVNEQRVFEAHRLETGDRIRFGNQIFKYLTADRIEAQYHEVIFKLMTTDGLTSVYNKRYFQETLEREIQQSHRADAPLCVMMLDLDKFKSINDTRGHLAGDAVLVEFARRAKSVLRSGDLLARYGGEEFALLLTRTTLGDAAEVGERIRQLTASAPVEFEEHLIPMTVSIGICCSLGFIDGNMADLLAGADEQLYMSKRLGRNQVQFARPDGAGSQGA